MAAYCLHCKSGFIQNAIQEKDANLLYAKKNLSAGIPHFLSYIKEILKSKGFVVLLTGNNNSIPAKMFKNNWWYLRFSEYIVFPSIKYLSQLNDFTLQDHQNTYAFKSNEKINF